MELVNSIRSEFVMIMLVSSAKSTGFAEVAMVFGRSFMYSIKNNGPTTYSWNLRSYKHLYFLDQMSNFYKSEQYSLPGS